MRLSVIVPAFNASRDLGHTLDALLPQLSQGDECIVVDDVSTDHTVKVATRDGVCVVRMPRNSGPAAVRNHGVSHASHDVLLFLDSDVVPSAQLLEAVRRHFIADPELAAVIGSYDEHPAGQSVVSRFRNLLHCYTHQTGNREAGTFWAGCGAMRRDVFLAVGGFDALRYPVPSLEDVELGLRLRAAGHRIVLDPSLQVKHRKVWTLAGMIRTDIFCRAVPWSTLIFETGKMPADLNLKISQRLAAIAVGLSAVLLPLFLFWPREVAVALLVLLGYAVAVNGPFYRFLARCGGWGFALRSIPVHWVYYLSGLAGYAIAFLRRLQGKPEFPAQASSE